MNILLLGAMPTELQPVLSRFSLKLSKKILDTYPLYRGKFKKHQLYALQTHVGELNSAIAASKCLQNLKPTLAIKIGCVGGTTHGINGGEMIIPQSFFHS